MRGEIGVQLRLGLKQAVNWDRCDRLSTCSTPSPGEAPYDPLCGRG